MQNEPYDRFGDPYDVQRVLNDNHQFDAAKYADYSPLYLPASYAITYLVAFALASAMIVHTLLYHSRTLLKGLTQARIEKDDIHAKLMRAYPEVPDWWYLITFAACFALAIVTAEVCSVRTAALSRESELASAGVAHGHPCVGVGARNRAAGHVHHSFRIRLCDDWTECECRT